jgi:hypothetical protein
MPQLPVHRDLKVSLNRKHIAAIALTLKIPGLRMDNRSRGSTICPASFVPSGIAPCGVKAIASTSERPTPSL